MYNTIYANITDTLNQLFEMYIDELNLDENPNCTFDITFVNDTDASFIKHIDDNTDEDLLKVFMKYSQTILKCVEAPAFVVSSYIADKEDKIIEKIDLKLYVNIDRFVIMATNNMDRLEEFINRDVQLLLTHEFGRVLDYLSRIGKSTSTLKSDEITDVYCDRTCDSIFCGVEHTRFTAESCYKYSIVYLVN